VDSNGCLPGNAVPPFSLGMSSPSNRKSRAIFTWSFHCGSYSHQEISCPFEFYTCWRMNPSPLENSHDSAQGCCCAVVRSEICHPSDGKYWVHFLLPCFLRWHVVLLCRLGCVRSHRRKVWVAHRFLGRQSFLVYISFACRQKTLRHT
jgi:hypothetical protein